MMLKPSPPQAALADEAIQAAIRSGKYDVAEEEWLREFSRDLNQYVSA